MKFMFFPCPRNLIQARFCQNRCLVWFHCLFEIIYFFSIKNISTYLATVKINSQKIIIISIYREPVLGLALHQSHPLTFYMYIYVENVKWGLNKPKFPHLVFYLVSSKDLWHLQLKVLSFILFRAIFSTEITN